MLILPFAAPRAQPSIHTRQAKVLVLYGVAAGSPVHFTASTTLKALLAEPLGERIAIYEEFPNFAWMADPAKRLETTGAAAISAFRTYLTSKYSGTSFDLVLVVGAPAFDIYRESEPRLFPGTPVIACLVASDRIEQLPLDPLVSIVTDSIELRGTLDLALTMQPDTKHVVVIGGASAGDRAYVARAKDARAEFSRDIGFTFVAGRPLSEVERLVARLEPRSIILFLSMLADSLGNQYDPLVVTDRLVAAANAPIYSWSAGPLGHGFVGGQIDPVDSSVTRVASLALRALGGEPFARLPRRVVNNTVRLVDWRALQRWNLDEQRVPHDATIILRERSVWVRYGGVIGIALALIVAQSLVIAAMMIQRAHRRRAEEQSRALLSDLRESNEQVHHLAGRLITTQEAERSRIGRELHDDVNQKIAALSIGLSRLRHHPPQNASELSSGLSHLEDRTASLADDVRQISHRLHSSVLQHVGVVAALDAACRELAEQNHVQATLSTTGELDSVDDDIALCLYRVAQEALRNAARHANAQRIALTVVRDDGGITLSVVDDGRGFETNGIRMNPGLGLISLAERARLVHGRLDVESAPGHGATIRLSIPLRTATPSAVPSLEDYAASDRIAR